jgi:hypothetical protein
VLLGPTIRHVSSKIALYLVLSLILVRVLPVAAPDAREQRRVAHGAFRPLVWPARTRVDRVRVIAAR